MLHTFVKGIKRGVLVVFNLFRKKKEFVPLPPPPIRQKAKPESELPEISFKEEKGLEFPLIPDMPDIRPAKLAEISPKPKQVKVPMKREIIVNETVKPMFVSVEDYDKINDHLAKLRSRLKEAEDTVDKLEILKDEQESALDSWMQSLEEIERKITKVDEVIAKHSEIN